MQKPLRESYVGFRRCNRCSVFPPEGFTTKYIPVVSISPVHRRCFGKIGSAKADSTSRVWGPIALHRTRLGGTTGNLRLTVRFKRLEMANAVARPRAALHKESWAVIDRPYSLGFATVGALYERPRYISCARLPRAD